MLWVWCGDGTEEDRGGGRRRGRKKMKDKKSCLTSFICCCWPWIQFKLLFLVFSFQEPKHLADFRVI